VLPVPKRLRPYLHHDVRVAGTVLQIFLRAIRTTLNDPTAGEELYHDPRTFRVFGTTVAPR
jgi:hypothetical protein